MNGVDRLYWQRYRRQYDVDGLEQTIAAFRRDTPDEARRALAGRLRDQIRYFARRPDALPEWRDAAAIGDLDELWRVWPSLPILTKQDLQSRFSVRALRAIEVDGIADATGGSTGEPTRFIHDAAFKRTLGAVTVLTRQELGWRPGLPTVCVWGAQRDIGQGLTGWRKLRHGITSRLSRLHEVDGFSLTDETARRVYDRLIACRRGAAIYGFGSMLEHVARVVQRKGWPVPRGLVRAAWNGGEMLHDAQVRLFESVFGVPILDNYGGRELGTIATQHAAGGPLHVVRPCVFLELVGDDGRPVAPGQPGRVVLTSTMCRGTPFLRYDIGDLATASAASVDESGVARLDALLGRAGSVLHLPNGATISNNYWNHLFKELEEVTQFQVRLKPDGSIALSFVGRPFGAQREAWLRRTLEGFIGAIPVQIAWVDAIPATRLGKRLQVVVE
jgi:phenylacetate-coenzyme A ligase PaaK-like adenylate-forming protein